ncbi:hypothetical protein MyChFU_01450 [Mycobacterium intracellulare subsp. chimaera]
MQFAFAVFMYTVDRTVEGIYGIALPVSLRRVAASVDAQIDDYGRVIAGGLAFAFLAVDPRVGHATRQCR